MFYLATRSLSLVLALILGIVGTGCVEGGTTEDWIVARTGVDIGELILIQSTDTHGGIFFDGGSLDVFECSHDQFFAIDGDWQSLPLSENLDQLVYGEYREPQAEVPPIDHGFYMFFDRHDEATDPTDDSRVLERPSVNVSLFIYDADEELLYYYEYDT